MTNTTHRGPRGFRTLLSSVALAAAALGFAWGSPGLASASASVASAPPAVALFAAPALEGKVNINTATQDQLELLPGIGPAMAKKVIAYRSKRPFKDVTHIIRIKGIGHKTFRKLKPFLAVEGATTLRVADES